MNWSSLHPAYSWRPFGTIKYNIFSLIEIKIPNLTPFLRLGSLNGHSKLPLSLHPHRLQRTLPRYCTELFIHSFIHSLRFLILCFAVPKRPRMDGFVSGFNETGLLAVQHNAQHTIPLSLSFCKVINACCCCICPQFKSLILSFSLSQTSKFGHILAVSDEEGYVTLFDTRRKFPVTSNFEENSGFFAFSVLSWNTRSRVLWSLMWKFALFCSQRKWRFVIGFLTIMLFLIPVGIRYISVVRLVNY